MDFEVESLIPDEPTPELKRKNKHQNNQQSKKFKHNEEPGKLSKAELFKPPTVEELNQLRETEILFNSNLFRLQTEELLKEITIKEKRIKSIDQWIENFKEHIENIPALECNLKDLGLVIGESQPEKLTKKLKNILTHYPSHIKTDVDSHFKLQKPQVQITGLYNIKTIYKPIAKININLIIPKNSFLEKDYLNFRYITKRLLYLSYVTTYLKNSKLISGLKYNYLYGNKLIPVLEITPADIKNTIFIIRITPEENTFKLSRFEPEKINIRSTYINSIESNSLQEDFCTPFYNSVLLNDLTLNENDKYKSELVNNLKGAREGLILLSIWLEQRKLSNGFGGFNENLLYSLIAYLIKNGKINKHMSSYQVIRNVWTCLSTSNWEKTGISLSDTPYDLEIFHKYYDVVFIDKSGKYNLAADLDLNIYMKIKHEAALAVTYLDDGRFNSFQALFITKMPFYLQFDAVINIESDEKLSKIFETCKQNYQVDFVHFKSPVVQKEIINKLKIGLSDRIQFLIPLINTETSWDVDKYEEVKKSVTIGVSLNYFNLHKVVEKGPPTYDPEAQSFRDFWGDKAELRRFKDGTITEAVYWEAGNIQEKRAIFKDIINFVLETKLKLKKFSIASDQLDSILKLYPYSGVEEANIKIVNIFDELGKLLRGMKLPLDVTAIQGTSEAFSYSDAYPPVQSNYVGGKKITVTKKDNILLKEDHLLGMVPRYVCPIEGVIQMAHHSKWPNDYEALSKLKTAFYIEISKLLKKEENIKSNPKYDFLEILYNGLVFRLSIFHPKQIIELKKRVDELGVMSFEDNEESLLQEQKYILLPKLISSLNGLHSQYPSYGPSTALIKRWFNSQLIDDYHFPKILINLLNASLYLNSSPFTQPALPQLTFFRFLYLLATTDWNLQPVILNFNNEITREQLDEHESQFHRNRPQFNPLHIITPFDNFKSVLTKNNPTPAILNRLRILGKESIDIIEKKYNSRNLFSTIALFKPNLEGYNLLIHLKPLLNPKRHQSVEGLEEKHTINIKEYEKNDEDKIPVVDFNPIDLYLKELRSNYDDYALFFHDSYGGNVIGVLWKPIINEEQEFKIANVSGKKLTKDKKLKVNTDAIIEDFYILGDGLVRTIETK